MSPLNKINLKKWRKGGICSRARLEIGKGQVVFFEKFAQKISTLNPCQFPFCPLWFSYRKPYSAKLKIARFRYFSLTDKTTQNKKDTREISRIFYATIAPDCLTFTFRLYRMKAQ